MVIKYIHTIMIQKYFTVEEAKRYVRIHIEILCQKLYWFPKYIRIGDILCLGKNFMIM